MEKDVFVCSHCKKTFYGQFGACFYIDKKPQVYCKSCSKIVENISKLPEVMIVPTTPLSFEFIKKNKVYFHPSSYSRKGGQYIAFYISNPVSAITHLAKVKCILKDQDPKSYLSEVNFEKEVKSVRIYRLDKLEKLKIPIKKGNFKNAIQGTQNTTLSKLKNAKNLKQLL